MSQAMRVPNQRAVQKIDVRGSEGKKRGFLLGVKLALADNRSISLVIR